MSYEVLFCAVLSLTPFSFLRWGFMYPRLVLNFLCGQGWPWTSDLSASISWVRGIQVCAGIQCVTMLYLCALGIEPRTSHVLSQHSTNWAPSEAPALLHQRRVAELCFVCLIWATRKSSNPYATLHRLLACLHDCSQLCGHAPAHTHMGIVEIIEFQQFSFSYL